MRESQTTASRGQALALAASRHPGAPSVQGSILAGEAGHLEFWFKAADQRGGQGQTQHGRWEQRGATIRSQPCQALAQLPAQSHQLQIPAGTNLTSSKD